MDENITIEVLDNKKHNTKLFDCEVVELNNFISKFAAQQQKKFVGRTFVAIKPNNVVIGFYTLSAGSVKHADAPDGLKKGLPQYPIPVATLGRLAVDKSMKGKGMGSMLLKDALHKVITASENIALVAVIVDAKNESAVAFYRQYGFAKFESIPSKLFLPLKTILKALPS